MTNPKLAAAGIGAALFTLLAGSLAVAGQPAPAFCQTGNPTKVGRAVTHCVAWTHEAAARLRAANCEPSIGGGGAMRAQCLAMSPG
jgi:hypothetical protein